SVPLSLMPHGFSIANGLELLRCDLHAHAPRGILQTAARFLQVMPPSPLPGPRGLRLVRCRPGRRDADRPADAVEQQLAEARAFEIRRVAERRVEDAAVADARLVRPRDRL